VWGRRDRFVPLELAEAACNRLGWPLHVIDDAGHVPHIEQADAFLRALHVSLDNPSGSGAAASSAQGFS
jgi:pimeloyl-ACP methyl ester carboxylesterase